MGKTTLNVRIDKQDKETAKVIFDNLGLDMSTAINMFIKQTIIANGLPFQPTLNFPQRIQVSSQEELNAKLLESEQDLAEGRTKNAEEFFDEMSKKYGFKI